MSRCCASPGDAGVRTACAPGCILNGLLEKGPPVQPDCAIANSASSTNTRIPRALLRMETVLNCENSWSNERRELREGWDYIASFDSWQDGVRRRTRCGRIRC